MADQAAVVLTQLACLLRCSELPGHGPRRCQWSLLLLLLHQQPRSRSTLSLPAAWSRQRGRLGWLGIPQPLQQCLQRLENISQRMRQGPLLQNLTSLSQPSNRSAAAWDALM